MGVLEALTSHRGEPETHRVREFGRKMQLSERSVFTLKILLFSHSKSQAVYNLYGSKKPDFSNRLT